MQKTSYEFATVTKNGVVEQIGRSSILQPKINYKGGSIKWYEDKLKPEQPEVTEK